MHQGIIVWTAWSCTPFFWGALTNPQKDGEQLAFYEMFGETPIVCMKILIIQLKQPLRHVFFRVPGSFSFKGKMLL